MPYSAGRRRVYRDFVASAIGLFLAGCGGAEETTTSTTDPPLTRAEFVREADRICFSGDSRIEAAADDLLASGRDPSPAEVRRIALGIVVPGLEAEVRAIRALGAPPGDEAEVEQILAATERGIAEIEADPAQIEQAPPRALVEAGRLARRYGSEQCGAR